MARGAFPDSHPQHLGMPGMHGTVAAVAGLQRSDLIISLGARFDDRVTGNLDSFAPHAKVIHADIDPAEIGKNRHADVPIVGDAREVIADLVVALQAEADAGHQGDYEAWVAFLAGREEEVPARLRPARRRLAVAAVRHRAARQDRRARGDLRLRRRPAPDVGRAVHRLREPGHLDQLRRPRHHGLLGARPRWAPRSAGPRRRSGRSTATAASR